MRSTLVCLKDMVRSMEAVASFIEGMDFDTFDHDLKTKSAVLAQLAMMGEAAKQIPPTLREAYPTVAWKSMAGMRDRLIHGYFPVDYALVWHTITEILPADRRVIETMIACGQ